jgi:hypothetical protein
MSPPPLLNALPYISSKKNDYCLKVNQIQPLQTASRLTAGE